MFCKERRCDRHSGTSQNAMKFTGSKSALLHRGKKLLSTTTTTNTATNSVARTAVRRLAQLSAGLLTVGFGYRYATDEGTRRSVAFWKTVGPAYLHYRYAEYICADKSAEESERRFNQLHDHYAPIIEREVLKHRGFYLKLAQFMSTVDFFVPTQYLEFCKRMQSEVPTEFKPGEAEEFVAASLKLDSLDQVFQDFSPDPIGSASIGQVHVATLKKNGEKVAIKVMGRGVEQRFRADIKTILDFVNVAMPQHRASMLEIQKQFETEFDYQGEAQNLVDVRANVLPVFPNQVYIPKPHLDLCTKQVLTMEYLPGPSFIKGIRESYGKYAATLGMTYDELEAQQKELISRPDYVYKDVTTEARKLRMYSYLTKTRDALDNSWRWIYNITLGNVFAHKLEYRESLELLNLAAVIQLLCRVHAHEIMVDGAFSCDSHPGNVLLMPDGRLGLIDMGQFKRIPVESRIIFAKIIVALANDDEAEVVRSLRRAGVQTKYNKSMTCFRLGAFWFDRNTEDVTGGLNPQQFMDEMESQDPSKGLPEDLIMPGRVSVLMRAVGNAFGMHLSVAKLYEPVAREVLRKHGVEYTPVKSKYSDIPDGFL